MQAIAPATTFHDTSSLLIHNLHLTVDHHVFIVFIEHAVSLQQLLEGVYTLTLYGEVVQQLVFLIETLLIRQSCLCLQGGQLRGNVRQHEQLGIIHLLRKPGCTLICQVTGVQFLIHHKIQRLNSLRHPTVIVLHICLLGLQHTCFDTFFGEVFDEWLVFGQGLVGTIERQETGIELLLTFFLIACLHQFVTFTDECLGISQILRSQLSLYTNESFYQWLILLEHLIIALRYRTRYDQRGTRIVDQHRVNLVDDGVVV